MDETENHTIVSDNEAELAELVPRAAAGDRRAVTRIIQIVHPVVLRYARSRLPTGRTQTAEDVAQEICLAVATSVKNYVYQGKPFMAFVYGIANNKVADAHRAQGRDHSNPTDEIPEPADTITPEELALVSDGSNRARELLDSLSDKAREIVILRVFEGYSADETASIVGSTPGAVRVAQHRALASLKKQIQTKEQ